MNVRGLLKADPVKEEPQPYIDCTGNLQVINRMYRILFYHNRYLFILGLIFYINFSHTESFGKTNTLSLILKMAAIIEITVRM